MRHFEFIKQQRRRSLAAVEHEFARARAEVPALAEHEMATDAVRTLKRSADDPAKVALTETLLLEVCQGRSALSTLLLLGYLPMLEFLLRFGSGVIDDALRESMVLEAFSEAVAGYRGLVANPCHYLRIETRRRFRRAVRAYEREQSRTELVDVGELDHQWGDLWESKAEASQAALGVRGSLAESHEELSALLRSEVGDRMPRERLDLVEATLLRGEDLGAYVDRTLPGLSKEERKRAHDRLRCQRNRTVHALRELLAPWRQAQLREAGSTAPVPDVAGTLGAPTPSWDGSEFTIDE